MRKSHILQDPSCEYYKYKYLYSILNNKNKKY